MKFFRISKNQLTIGPVFQKPENLFRYFLLILIVWLPLKEWGPISLYLGDSSGLVAPVLVLGSLLSLILTNKLTILWGRIEKIFSLFLGLTVISAFLGIITYHQFLPVLRDTVVIFELFFLYLLGKNLKKTDFDYLAKIGTIEALFVALYGIWQYWEKVPINPLWIVPGEALRARAFATFLSPNGLASYLLVWFWVSFYLSKQKRMWLFASGFIALSIYFTYSRSALLALLVGALGFLLLNINKINWKILFGGLSLAFLSVIFYAKRLLTIFSPTYLFYSGEAGRSWAIKNVLHILPAHLFWGVGPGLYGGQTATQITSPVYLEGIQHGFAATYVTDNQYLQILIQQGIFGFFSYLWLFWEITKKIFQRAKTEMYFGGAILAIWLGYSVQGFFENIWFIQATATIVWIIIGLGLKD